MAQRPFLLFPSSATVERARLGGGGGRVVTPTPDQQKQRLDAKFQNIAASISAVQTSAQGLEPEQVIVLETLGDSIKELASAAERIPGLEWLAELDMEDQGPGDGFQIEGDPQKRLSHRLYALMTNQRAMSELLTLWQAWIANPQQSARRGFGPFKSLFIHLKDVRRWGPQDRIQETQVIEDWRETLQAQGAAPVRFEAELWYRSRPDARAAAYNQLLALVSIEGGRSVVQASVDAIHYHGVLLEMPADAVSRTLERIRQGDFTDLLRCEGVMFFRPVGQARFPTFTADAERFSVRQRAAYPPMPAGAPQIALLDGAPLEHHVLLDGRVQIDDPDSFSQRYQPAQQYHGTSMASLIVHGDISEDEPPLTSPIYVRPVLIPTVGIGGEVNEHTPSDQLIVDLIHRAVRRIAVELDATKSSVRIVNLSIGDTYKPFIRELSPLARLLDWLAWEYKLLFLVSAGNQGQDVILPVTPDDFGRLPDDQAVQSVLRAMADDQPSRRHLSPAEAVNVLTVGAIHADASQRLPQDRRVDLLRDRRLPSPISTVSAGFKRSIKPEILLPGGKQLYQPPFTNQDGMSKFKAAIGFSPPGQMVAAPGQHAMELDRTVYSRGTSNATALATRTAARILARLDELRAEYADLAFNPAELAALAKALLVHGASWGKAGEEIERLLATPTDDWREKQRIKARFLGFGEIDVNRCLFCTDQRVTVLGWGYLVKDSAHVYRFPLPRSLSAQHVARRLAVTLAWLTPINPQHRDYRKAALWYTFDGAIFGVDRGGLDQDTAKRGTVLHQVFEGRHARAFLDDAEIKVNCREQASSLREQVPYAIAVTLEVAEGIQLPIYEEVRTRVRTTIPIAAGTTSR